MKNSRYTYRFEVRTGGYRQLITLTDDPKTAYRHAQNTPGFVMIIDNDNQYPIACRMHDGKIQVIQNSFKAAIA